MSHDIVWEDDARTIIRQTYHKDFVVDDIYALASRNAEMMGSVSHPVDLILDLSQVGQGGTNFFSSMRYVNDRTPENQRLLVLVTPGNTTYINILINIGRKLFPKMVRNIHMVKTLEEAHACIAAYRAELADPAS